MVVGGRVVNSPEPVVVVVCGIVVVSANGDVVVNITVVVFGNIVVVTTGSQSWQHWPATCVEGFIHTERKRRR